VFEVTATPTPMNHDTRVLAWKAAAERAIPTHAEQRRRFAALKATLPRSTAEMREQSDRVYVDTLMGGIPHHEPEPARPSERELRQRCDRVRVELALGGIDMDAKAAREP
jgi:hypothetical protein